VPPRRIYGASACSPKGCDALALEERCRLALDSADDALPPERLLAVVPVEDNRDTQREREARAWMWPCVQPPAESDGLQRRLERLALGLPAARPARSYATTWP